MLGAYSYAQLQNEVGTNAERLAYIDFKLRFSGTVRRRDLFEEFGLAEAAASRMMTLYTSFRNDNHYYDRKTKVNSIKLDTYSPLLPIDSETALGMLAHGFNKNKLLGRPVVPYRRIGRIQNQLDEENVSLITRALYNQQAVNCCYISGNSTNHEYRELIPLALMHDGRNWIFRAYDRSAGIFDVKYKNFNFSRVAAANTLDGDAAKGLEHESLANDSLWNIQVPISLTLHPNLTEEQKKPIRKDFGLSPEEDELVLTESAALVWILTKQWDVDIGKGGDPDSFFKFKLKNADMLKEYL